MSEKPVGVVALLTEIGDANIGMQNLDMSAIDLDWHHKKGTTIKFGTDASLTHNGTEKLGLVIWLDRDKVAAALEKLKS